MTSKTSWFNFGIYKNTLHRFKWGSFLYFIILFFSVPFVLMTESPSEVYESFSLRNYQVGGLILKNSFMVIPYLMAMIVPSIVALLIFRNVHSSKQGVFTHSIPVTRKSYYISNLLGGFSLMLAPILLNAVILLAMSVFGYGKTIAPWSIMCWVAVQMAVLFIMFSVASFSAFLTGNGVAHIVINVLLHTFPLLIAGAILLVSEVFLFGFVQSENFIAEEIFSNTPLVWLFTRMTLERFLNFSFFGNIRLWIYVIIGAALYVLGYLLYKNRKIEACGDVAAFRVFRPILKYAVTAIAELAILAILWAMELPAVAIFIVAAVVCAVVYFICEMLMNKTFKVFATYKGFAVFAVCSALLISFCAYTSVFGYETRIPATDKIEKATIYSGYFSDIEEPFVDDEESINAVRAMHKEFLADVPLTEREVWERSDFNGYNLYVKYKLKNGRVLARRYLVNNDLCYKALMEMYKNVDYKMQITGLSDINIENVKNADLRVYFGGFNHHIALNYDSEDVLRAIKKDVEVLSYNDMSNENYNMEYDISFSLSYEENEKQKVFKETAYGTNPEKYQSKRFSVQVTSKFTNTITLLKELGYYDEIVSRCASNLWICKEPLIKAGELLVYKGQEGHFGELYANQMDCVKLEPADAFIVSDSLIETKRTDPVEGKNYFIFSELDSWDGGVWFARDMVCYPEEKLPEYLKKYINN